jgi:predicted CXXCH cytochrome family protein
MGRRRHVGLLAALPVSIGFLTIWNPPVRSQEVDHFDHLVNLDGPEQCLNCHDGTIGPDISFCTVDCGIDISSSHPAYRLYPYLRKPSEFASPSHLEAVGIKLTNGEVTCVSCHDLAQGRKHLLVFDNDHSRLCLTCHIR